jgi:hypothetical protein
MYGLFGSGKMKWIYDSSFKYTRSTDTDLRKTFERIRRAQRAARRKEAESSLPVTVVQFNRGATVAK